MVRIKTFDIPHSHDKAWYENRELADHINQSDHQPRLLQVLEYLHTLIQPEMTICDFGAGNGGLIREIQKEYNNEIWGYDLCPANVKDAQAKGTDVTLLDFINEPVLYPDIAICTETLEHLVDPDAFIQKLKENGVQYVIASSPDYETEEFHAPFHLWVFTADSYKEMFEPFGEVLTHYKNHFQYIVCKLN